MNPDEVCRRHVMTHPATRASWRTLPLPSTRETFELALILTDADGDTLRQGHVPGDMDDKWFVFFEGGWLYFHRSWTGYCTFGLRLDGSSAGVRIVESWVSRDPEQYRSSDVEYDKRLIQDLLRWLLRAA